MEIILILDLLYLSMVCVLFVRQYILLLVTICPLVVFSQTDEFFEEHVSNYDLEGKVKKVIITEDKEYWIGEGKKRKFVNIKELSFNEDGYLEKYYHTNDDGFKFLCEENSYNLNNDLLTKTEYKRKDTTIVGKVTFLKHLLKYETKYTYNSNGNLLTKHQKSYRDKDFYLVEKNKYLGKLLLENLSLNNHLRFKYSKGSFFQTYLSKYVYNSKGNLTNTKEFVLDQKLFVVDSIKNNGRQTSPIVFRDSDIDYSKFILDREIIQLYNTNNQLVKKEIRCHDESYLCISMTTQYEYFGSRELKVLYSENNSFVGHLYDYKVVNKDTLVALKWNLGQFGKREKLVKYKDYEIDYNLDGSFIKTFYDQDENQTKTNLYDKRGELVEQLFPKIENTNRREIIYDEKGNLISKKVFYLPQNKEVFSIEKIIEYYD